MTAVRRRLTAADIWPEDEAVLHVDARKAVLRRLLPASLRDLVLARPDLWSDDSTGHRRLEKDLARVDAVFDHASRVWDIPAKRPVDPRLEKVARARRLASEYRNVPPTDVLALLEELDAQGDPGTIVGTRLLGEWVAARKLTVRRAARELGLHPFYVSRWLRGVLPRAHHRIRLAERAGIPTRSWTERERHTSSVTPTEPR